MIRPGIGYKVKNVSGQTSLVIDPPRKPAPLQFECTVLTEKVAGVTKRWMKVEPGFAKILNYTVMLTSMGNRDVSVGDASIQDSSYLADTKLYKVEGCNCYKTLRYSTNAATLALNQFELETEEDTLVVLYRAAPGYGKPRLAVISASLFASTFRYGPTSISDGEGSVPTIKHVIVKNDVVYGTTTTIPGTPPTSAYGVTEPIPSVSVMLSMWDRLGLSVKVIARYNIATKQLTQYHTGDVDLTETAESYIVSKIGTIVTTGPCIDDGWAASYYVTGGTGAPAGYTFNYSV
jgi:hypothetical protein